MLIKQSGSGKVPAQDPVILFIEDAHLDLVEAVIVDVCRVNNLVLQYPDLNSFNWDNWVVHYLAHDSSVSAQLKLVIGEQNLYL